MQANDAMKILGSAAAMGLLGGGGALAYNAVSQPTLDEYGNTIESNDINPFVAALGGAAVGAVGGGIYGHYNQPVAKPMQGMSAGASPQPRQSPDIVEPEIMQTQRVPRESAGYSPESYWEQSPANERTAGNLWDDLANAVDDATNPEARAARQSQMYEEIRQQRQQNKSASPPQRAVLQGDMTLGKRFVPELSSEQEALYAQARQLGISPHELESRGWRYNPNQPIVQIVPSNPMELQNPMSPPGMKTVVMQQPPKAPGQEMMEDVLRLRELANRQRQERQSVARIDMALNGWGRSPEWQAKYGERMPQNAAGWDVMLPQNSYERNRELTEIDKYLAQKKIG